MTGLDFLTLDLSQMKPLLTLQFGGLAVQTVTFIPLLSETGFITLTEPN